MRLKPGKPTGYITDPNFVRIVWAVLYKRMDTFFRELFTQIKGIDLQNYFSCIYVTYFYGFCEFGENVMSDTSPALYKVIQADIFSGNTFWAQRTSELMFPLKSQIKLLTITILLCMW